MKIWHKILISPAVAIVFLLAFGALTYEVLTRQSAALEELATKRSVAVEAANDSARQISEAHAAAYRLFTWRAPEEHQRSVAALTDKIDGVTGYLTGFRAQPDLTDDERKHLNAVLPKISDYRRQVEAASSLNVDAASAIDLMQSAEKAYQAALHDLAGLMALEKKLARESYEGAASAARQAVGLLLAILASAAVVSIAIALVASRAIVRPLASAIRTAGVIASGDLSTDVQVVGRDETADLLRALSEMNRNLRELVGEVAAGAHGVADTSEQIAQGNIDLSQRTEEQASTLEETASSMEELTSTVSQNAQNAHKASELATGAADVARKGGEVVAKVVGTMTGISESSRKIGDIIGLIDGIAFQTNILALNAAVEAARAGEQGRGFAVVASEVRSLAQRSAAAAKDIKTLIRESVEKVDAGTRMADAAGATMREIVDSAGAASHLITEIAAASREQSSGIQQVNTAVMQMEQVVQQNASLVEQATAATESMKAQAGALLEMVARFKLEGEAPSLYAQLQPAGRSQAPRHESVEAIPMNPASVRLAVQG